MPRCTDTQWHNVWEALLRQRSDTLTVPKRDYNALRKCHEELKEETKNLPTPRGIQPADAPTGATLDREAVFAFLVYHGDLHSLCEEQEP